MDSYKRREGIASGLVKKSSHHLSSYDADRIAGNLADAMQDDEEIQYVRTTHPEYSSDGRLLVVTNRSLFVCSGYSHDKLENQFFLGGFRLIDYTTKMLKKNSGTLTLETLDNRRTIIECLNKEEGQEIADFLKRASGGRAAGKGAR